MPTNNDNDNFDTQTLMSLFERTQPAHTDVDIQAIMTCERENAREQVDEKYLRNNNPWGSKMIRFSSTNVGVRAAVLIGTISILGLFLIPSTLNENVAFAQIKERIDAVRTVEYVETSYASGKLDQDNPLKQPTLEETTEQLKARLKEVDSKLAKELEFELKFLSELQAQKANVLYVRRVRVKGKHLQRTDQLFPMVRSHVIRDAASGLTVSFFDDEKRKEVLTKQVKINPNGDHQEADIPKVPPTVDFFNQFTSIPQDGLEKLPPRLINGKNVVGVRSTEEREGKTWIRTYWIQPDLRLPIELWTELHKGSELKQRWVMNQFSYDLPMDDGLFSTETPEGYTSGEGKVFGISPK